MSRVKSIGRAAVQLAGVLFNQNNVSPCPEISRNPCLVANICLSSGLAFRIRTG
jgi:hypothetical protein